MKDLWSRALLYADGNGKSTQLHMISRGERQPERDIGIVEKIVFNSAPPQGESEEAQPWGPSDLKGEVEWSYWFQGRWYGSLDDVWQAYVAAGAPEFVPPPDIPCEDWQGKPMTRGWYTELLK